MWTWQGEREFAKCPNYYISLVKNKRAHEGGEQGKKSPKICPHSLCTTPMFVFVRTANHIFCANSMYYKKLYMNICMKKREGKMITYENENVCSILLCIRVDFKMKKGQINVQLSCYLIILKNMYRSNKLEYKTRPLCVHVWYVHKFYDIKFKT